MKLEELPFADRLARALPYLATAVIVIGVVNFFWFMAESTSMGDASQGKVVDGHYFLGNKGTYTEVDRGTWEWSQFHGVSIFVTHPLAMAGMAFVILRRAFPSQMAGSIGGDAELSRRRIDFVRGSGPLIVKESMAGRVGPVRMTAPLLEIAVHPKGLVVKARLMSEHAILAAEILGIVQRRIFLQQAVEVSHLGMGSKSPLLLYRAIDDPIVVAIRRIVADDAATPAPDEGSTTSAVSPSSVPMPVDPTGPNDAARPNAASLAGWSLAGEPAVPGLEPRWLGTVLEVLGLAVGVALLAHGVLWAMPKLDGFGVVWTLLVGAFLAWHGSKVVRRHLIRPHSRPSDAPTSSVEAER